MSSPAASFLRFVAGVFRFLGVAIFGLVIAAILFGLRGNDLGAAAPWVWGFGGFVFAWVFLAIGRALGRAARAADDGTSSRRSQIPPQVKTPPYTGGPVAARKRPASILVQPTHPARPAPTTQPVVPPPEPEMGSIFAKELEKVAMTKPTPREFKPVSSAEMVEAAKKRIEDMLEAKNLRRGRG